MYIRAYLYICLAGLTSFSAYLVKQHVIHFSFTLYRTVITKLTFPQVKIFAPNTDQMHVVDHLKGSPTEEKRNVLVESARLARGDIQDLSELSVKDLDAIIFPG